MLVKTSGRKFIIKFLHSTGQGRDGLPVKGVKKFSQCIVRELHDDKTIEFLGIGYSYVHPQDNFVKEMGRTVSLNRALSDAELNFDEKLAVWIAYNGRKK